MCICPISKCFSHFCLLYSSPKSANTLISYTGPWCPHTSKEAFIKKKKVNKDKSTTTKSNYALYHFHFSANNSLNWSNSSKNLIYNLLFQQLRAYLLDRTADHFNSCDKCVKCNCINSEKWPGLMHQFEECFTDFKGLQYFVARA